MRFLTYRPTDKSADDVVGWKMILHLVKTVIANLFQNLMRSKPCQSHSYFVILISMSQHILYIKNMVCNRCIIAVQNELDKFHLEAKSIKLGEVTLAEEPTLQQKKELDKSLTAMGFEILDDKKQRTIEKIKNVIIETVHRRDAQLKTNLSDLISSALNQDYSALSNLFSEVEGITIEKYFIAQKIEKVKELLVYGELSLSQIADKLNYSSAAYLSNQFKRVTGLTPGHFKKIRSRKPIDEV